MSEHYQLIRTDPNYRYSIMLEELLAEREPAWEQEMPQEPQAVEREWNKRQWGRVQQLEARVLFLSNKVNELRAKRKHKSKY